MKKNIFLYEKPAKAMIALNSAIPSYVTTIAKEAGCTYSHAEKLTRKFKKLGLVLFERKGRIKYVKLTESGTSLAKKISELAEIL